MWISDAIDNQLVQPKQAKHQSGGPGAAIEWLRYNYNHIREDLRPPEHDLDEFGAFFSTYLTSSFDVVETPGSKGEGAASGCHCEVCVRIVNAPHLKTKKLFAKDKRRANFLMAECVTELAKEHRLDTEEEYAMRLATDNVTRRDAACIAYGHWLIKRLSGESDGPAILALWRIIAWDPRGGMRSGFTLELEDFKVAEENLLAAIRSGE